MGNDLTIKADTVQVGQAGHSATINISRVDDDSMKTKLADLLKKYPKQISIKDIDTHNIVVDKNGKIRMGRVVTTQPLDLSDLFKKIDTLKDFKLPERKPLDNVKKEQVAKFIENIKTLGLDLKEEDIVTKNGTLNPNFKVDENGNITFRNLKEYINGKSPEYFETDKGEWAVAEKSFKVDYALKSPKDNDLKIRPLPYYPGQEKPTIKLYSLRTEKPSLSDLIDLYKFNHKEEKIALFSSLEEQKA